MKNRYLLFLVVLVSIASLIDGFIENLVFSYAFYSGLGFLGICCILLFLNHKLFKTLFGIVLILGIFNIIQFTPFAVTIQVSFIKFEVIPTLFFLVFLFFNRSRVLDLIQDWISTSDEDKLESSSRKSKMFKEQFRNLSDQEIENRLHQNLVPEARNALMEIKEKRSL